MIPTRWKAVAQREVQWFRDAPLLQVQATQEIHVLIGAGEHLFVQAMQRPGQSKPQSDLETANWLWRGAQVMAASAGLVPVVQPATPVEGAPNG